MTGKYDINDPKLLVIPSLSSNEENCHKKTLCVHNASYVDNFFYYLSSVLLNNHNFINGIDYYGSFLGIQRNFKINITDDLEYISSSDFFVKNIGILFSADDIEINNEFIDTKKNKSILNIDDNNMDIDIDFIDLSSTIYEHDENMKPCSVTECDMSEFCGEDICDISDILSESSNENSETNYSEKDDDDNILDDDVVCDDEEYEGTEYTDSCGSEYSDDDLKDIFAHIKNFPTQMICLEMCEDTLDQLLVETKKRVDPNFSFDLCRLGCSMYDYIFDDDTDFSDLTQLQMTVKRWITDDNDYNILYKKNGAERYRGFKLYKMISRTVSAHTPEKQLIYPFFNQFKQKGKRPDDIMDIDRLPKLV